MKQLSMNIELIVDLSMRGTGKAGAPTSRRPHLDNVVGVTPLPYSPGARRESDNGEVPLPRTPQAEVAQSVEQSHCKGKVVRSIRTFGTIHRGLGRPAQAAAFLAAKPGSTPGVRSNQTRCGVTAARRVHTPEVRFESGMRNQPPCRVQFPALLGQQAGLFYSTRWQTGQVCPYFALSQAVSAPRASCSWLLSR